MTLLVAADVASYQGTLTASRLQKAGFGRLNLKVSHGLNGRGVHPAVATFAAEARLLGMQLSSFHWLDTSASGQAQAAYAYGRLQASTKGRCTSSTARPTPPTPPCATT